VTSMTGACEHDLQLCSRWRECQRVNASVSNIPDAHGVIVWIGEVFVRHGAGLPSPWLLVEILRFYVV
jgi:hypothetical protein